MSCSSSSVSQRRGTLLSSQVSARAPDPPQAARGALFVHVREGGNPHAGSRGEPRP